MKTKGLIIYLVDDDKDDRDWFCEALAEQKTDAKIKTFENGVDLMSDLLDKEKVLPDIIFLDLNMPLMNGEECLSDIRGEKEFSNIRLIIYSSYFDGEKIQLLQKKGADHYLRKPKSIQELKQSIERYIQSSYHNLGYLLSWSGIQCLVVW